MSKLQEFSKQIRNREDGIVIFAEKILGLPVSKHEGQMRWLQHANKRINILRPGNKFGKSFIGAVKHIYQAFTKINLEGMYRTMEEWYDIRYDTLNFGPGYEQAREIPRMVRDIVQGKIFIPQEYQEEYGVTNKSLLKDIFIEEDRCDAQVLPYIKFNSGTHLYARSYDEMGAAFKMKGLAYVSGDEVSDIQELWSFTNGTLLPRLVAYKNASIDYYGTPQAEGHDYMRMIEMAEQDMARPKYEKDGMFYVQKGAMYENPFLDKETVASIERVADPIMKRQIIYGEHVVTGDYYFGYQRIQNAVDMKLNLQTNGYPGRKYLVTCDFAAGTSYWSDYTVIIVLDVTEEPYKLVYFNRLKGGSVPIPMQYKLVEDVYLSFKSNSWGVKLIIDSSALGGKNALAFLKHLNPIQFEATPQRKAEMLATLKIAFDGGRSDVYKRKLKILPDGTQRDENPTWGNIRIPNIKELISELQNYKLDDDKIRTDSVMALGQAIHYLEMRRPRMIKNKMVPFDILKII